jgi:hypothetical protein
LRRETTDQAPPPSYLYKVLSEPRRATIAVAVLMALYLLVNCISLASVAYVFPDHHIGIGRAPAISAIVATLFAASLIPLFILARFSFGYLAGFSLYGMIAGFIWISYFSGFGYDHARGRLSASVSLIMFLLPALFVSIPLRKTITLSSVAMDRLLILMLVLVLLILLWNASHGIAFVAPRDGVHMRNNFVRPAILKYATGIAIGAVLPFAFAYFALQRRYWTASLAILLMVSFYPALLTKTVLFAPAWLIFLLVMFRLFEPKVALLLSLLAPMTAGLFLYAAALTYAPAQAVATDLLEMVNLRMFAIPSNAMDHYHDFFTTNPVTRFCQISFVRIANGCPYPVELGTAFADRYHLGNFNASLFATEGIASVGPVLAPVSALVCGLLLSAGNSVSARLPAPLVAVSSGLGVQALLNVPLSITLLSNGLIVLFLLWYITPDASAEGGGSGASRSRSKENWPVSDDSEKPVSHQLKPLGPSRLFKNFRRKLRRWFNRRPTAVFAVVLLSLVLNVTLYLAEDRRQAIRRHYASIDLDRRFIGPSFPHDMALQDRAEQTGLTRSSTLIGWLDKIADTAAGRAIFIGWVVDASYIDETPVVLIFINHQHVGSTVPNSPRPDVVKELKLNEEWSSTRIGFSADFPTSVCGPARLAEAMIISGNRYAIVRNMSIEPNCSDVSR